MHRFDYIVAGSGLAGLYVAWQAAKRGKVALLTKANITESNSYFAQGGIAAVTDEDDAPSLHFDDTIIAGRGLCDYPAVNVLVNEGPERIRELIDAGMHFDMEESGELALGLEGGHHKKRILHAGGDATGRMVTSFMIEQVMHTPNITIFENHSVLGLLQKDNECFGVRAWNIITNEENLFLADNTFLTLGGTSAIYKRTTNPHSTIGDGLALAYRAGCEIADMEFIQFHPSAIYTKDEEAFLVSEAVRGEGAYLINQNGERFMPQIHELAELAPRDIVAQSIFRQMQKHHQDFVWLSLKHLDPALIKRRFPNIYEKCKQLGIDMLDRIPVAPAAHYTVGGVRTDLNGRTNISHLYICGELASTGIMGANRLASNSLIECLVYGKRAVESAVKNPLLETTPIFSSSLYCESNKIDWYTGLKQEVSTIMTENAGIIRNETLLQKALYRLNAIQEKLDREDQNEYYTILAYNLITVGQLIIRSALYRKESRGGHYREDYPEANDQYLYHIVQQKNKPIKTIPVNITK